MLHCIKYPKENQEMHALFRGLLPESEALVESKPERSHLQLFLLLIDCFWFEGHECVCSLENPFLAAAKDQFSDMNDITDLSVSTITPAQSAGLATSGNLTDRER
jgi:hypothetical protein